MYCTGGVRCERASALLKSKYGDNVGEVYQLQVSTACALLLFFALFLAMMLCGFRYSLDASPFQSDRTFG